MTLLLLVLLASPLLGALALAGCLAARLGGDRLGPRQWWGRR